MDRSPGAPTPAACRREQDWAGQLGTAGRRESDAWHLSPQGRARQWTSPDPTRCFAVRSEQFPRARARIADGPIHFAGGTAMRRLLASLLTVAGLAAPSQGQVKLQWKLNEGDTFYVENVTRISQTVGDRKKL